MTMKINNDKQHTLTTKKSPCDTSNKKQTKLYVQTDFMHNLPFQTVQTLHTSRRAQGDLPDGL
jgi:hypothetical protein